jgi:hypothetical protein
MIATRPSGRPEALLTALLVAGPSHQWHLWILDVDGLRFVVQSTDYPGTSAKHRSELEAIVDSITIAP